MMNTYRVRKAVITDMAEVLELVQELAVFEREPDAVTADINDYEQAFISGLFDVLVAENDQDGIIGMALYYPRWSTWKGLMLHLEDFIVHDTHRRQGVGTMLFDAYIAEARRQGAVLCLWNVLDWNRVAKNFYDKYDVIYDTEWDSVKIYL